MLDGNMWIWERCPAYVEPCSDANNLGYNLYYTPHTIINTFTACIRRRERERRHFYLKSNKMVNTTLANSLLRKLHTQYVQHNIQYLQQIVNEYL